MVCGLEGRTGGTKSQVAPIFHGVEEGTGGKEPEVATMVGRTGCKNSGEWCPDSAGGVAPLPCRETRLG